MLESQVEKHYTKRPEESDKGKVKYMKTGLQIFVTSQWKSVFTIAVEYSQVHSNPL